MSTPITLTIGEMTLTYNTTYIGWDHGELFQEVDRQRRPHPCINYEYYEQHPDLDVSQSEMCFCRPLRSMVPRLEMLGYTLDAVRADFNRVVATDLEESEEIEAVGGPTRSLPMDFDRFLAFIRKYAVSELRDEYTENGHVLRCYSRSHSVERIRCWQTAGCAKRT